MKTESARLFMLGQRVNVNWAGYSMVQAEFILFRKAFANGPYAYYHLISGADLPIKSQDYIHAECERLQGTEFVAFAPATKAEVDYRVQHWFLFPEDFRSKNLVKKGLRYLFLAAQDLLRTRRTDITVKKGSQWCSLTQGFVSYLIAQESQVRNLFTHTFCPDELFIQTVISNSPFADKVKTAPSEFDGNMRYIKWKDGELFPIVKDDLADLRQSDKWFARKFSSQDKSLLEVFVSMSK